MELLPLFGIGVAAVSLLYWLLNLYGVARSLQRVPVLEVERPPEPGEWPKLSVIVPACDEAASIERATRAKLGDGYPDLELLLINDRSRDATGSLVDALAASDPRVKALHVKELPEGWLGKLHALHLGQQRASGEWLLFSDADVEFSPGALQRAIAYCEHRGLDHLTLFPQLLPVSFGLDSAIAAFSRTVFLSGRLWKVSDPASRTFAGVGAFNLMRRSALAKTPGLEWLKLEVGDDMALGQMLKRSGARSALVNGRGLVSLVFYESIAQLARGAEKGVVVFKFSLTIAVAASTAVMVLELSPFICLAWPQAPWVKAAGALALCVAALAQALLNRWLGNPVLPAVVWPVGSLLMIWAMARAGILGAARDGLVWRGTLYRSRALREGRRIQFP